MSDSTNDGVPEGPDRRMALARALRRARGDLLQAEMAALVGRPQSVVSNWETGSKTPTLEVLCEVERRLGLPLGTLALQAGYFDAEAVGGVASQVIASQVHHSLSDAARAVAAADLLGLGARLETEVVDSARAWRVDAMRHLRA